MPRGFNALVLGPPPFSPPATGQHQDGTVHTVLPRRAAQGGGVFFFNPVYNKGWRTLQA